MTSIEWNLLEEVETLEEEIVALRKQVATWKHIALCAYMDYYISDDEKEMVHKAFSGEMA